MDYEEMSEPNMKLSRALLIVLVLHVVAVAGIIAFNTIKAGRVRFRRPLLHRRRRRRQRRSRSMLNLLRRRRATPRSRFRRERRSAS
jgi:hypothetical protein